jgi:hypothetical protein
MQALQQIYNLRGNTCSLVNSTNITLLPKTDDALSPSDFRLVSLMHSVAKIHTKALANRLAPHISLRWCLLVRVRLLKTDPYKTTSSIYMGQSTISIDPRRQCYSSNWT